MLDFFVDLALHLLENENFFKLMHREMIDQDRDGIRRLNDAAGGIVHALCAAFWLGLVLIGSDPAASASPASSC